MCEVSDLRRGERGSAGTKFVLVLAVIMLIANAGYNYVPVAYQGETMKTDMETAVLQGLAVPGNTKPADNVKARLQKAMAANEIPSDAVIDVRSQGNGVTAHLMYNRPVPLIPFGIFTYTYRFDHTATPTGFLLKDEKN